MDPKPTQSTPDTEATPSDTQPHPVDTDVQADAAEERAENGGYD